MLGIGRKFPEFKLTGVVVNDTNKAFQDVDERDLRRQVAGRVLLAEGLHLRVPDGDRRLRQAQPRVRGPRRAAARRQHGLRVRAPRLAQVARGPAGPPVPDAVGHQARASTALGILDPEAGVAQRATFIVDPEGVIRFVYVTDLNVGRSPDEVLRVLDGLQTDELCPCNWQKGEDTLKAA